MSRTTRNMPEASHEAGLTMPVEELRGRAVWTESGDRLGTLRGFHTDEDGRIVSLDVRHGWIFGRHDDVDASSMRMEGGDVVVASNAVIHRTVAAAPAMRSAARTSGAPVLLAGRTGARADYGGLDPAAGLIGALVAVAGFVLLGGLLAAIFDTQVLALDSGSTSWDALTSEAMLVGAVALAASFLIGGWAAGRSARFSGAANGMSVVLWTVVIGVAFAVVGAIFGNRYDLFSTANLPQLNWSDVGLAGVVGMLVGLAIMLVFGTLGGILGSLRNRRVDRRMLDVMELGTVSGVDYSDDRVRSEIDHEREDVARTETGVIGTPAGSPVAARPIPTRDSPDDVTRPR